MSEGIISKYYPGYRPNEDDFLQIVNEALSKNVITKKQADDLIKAWQGN